MTLFFHYNASKFSLQNKKFADNYIAEVGCAYDETTDTIYECAVLEDVEQVFANSSIATILATLAEYMSEWSDYKQVDSKNELMSLIDKTLAYYGENIDTFYDKDDWDDYIVTLLEAKEVLGKTYISDDDLNNFEPSRWEDIEL
jgi:hypothetical protein